MRRLNMTTSSDNSSACSMGEVVPNKKTNTLCDQKLNYKKDGAPNSSDDKSNNTDNIDTVSDILGRLDISNNDELLFQDPPPKEDCPICMLPMPHSGGLPMPHSGGVCLVHRVYQPCCGKVLCYGCIMAAQDEIEKGELKQWCLFCRMPTHPFVSDKEIFKKRMKLNDFEAFDTLAGHYIDGDYGLTKNSKKGIELWNKAAELGSIRAHNNLANIYHNGDYGVKIDTEKGVYHWKIAAIGGHEIARHNLGWTENIQNKNIDRAMKHYMIAARNGNDESLKRIGGGYKAGVVTKDEYAATLRAYQNTLHEMKSGQRAKAGTVHD